MNRFFKYSALMFFLSFAIRAYPATPHLGCKPSKQLIKENLVAGYGWLSSSVAKPGIVVMIFIKRTGEWTMIGIDDNLTACTLMGGDNWKFALTQEI
jgi:hypothetical protein